MVRFFFGLGLTLALLASCASAPSTAPAKKGSGNNVWALLERGEFDAARKFFQGETGIDATDPKGRSPLHIAAEAQASEMTAFFIAMGAKMDLLDGEGRTPLSIAVEKRDAESARMLIEAGADIHHPQRGRQTPAEESIAIGGEFLRAIAIPAALEAADGNGRTMLHLAAFAGNASSVETIINNEENPLRDNNIRRMDHAGKNPLDLALARTDSKDHMEAAEKLILAGAASANPAYAYLAPAARSSNYNTRVGDGIAPLHYAAGQGYEGLTRFLLGKNVDINVKNAAGTTPLHEAARAGNLAIMDLLLQGGAAVNAQDAKGNTPMHVVIPESNHQEALAKLLLHGADPNLRDEHGESPLHILVSLGRPPATIETLFDRGADAAIRNIEGKTPLYLAVQGNRIDSTEALIRHGSNLFAADNYGVTPLDLALRTRSPTLSYLITEETALQSDSAGNTALHIGVQSHADTGTLALILDKKALVNARNKEGDTSLHLAVRDDFGAAGELLIARGADIFANNAARESPLYLSFPEKTPPGKVREWMLNPTTIKARDGAGNSILHYAAQWKLDRHIALIVRKGFDPNVPNAMGESPLFRAVNADSRSTVLALLAEGANVNARDTQGSNVLHAAVRWNALNAARALVENGADLNAHALNGKTPLHDSIRLGIVGMQTLLTGKGADLEVRDNEGNTPLMEAILVSDRPAAERLRALGADANTRNNRGDTPLHVAVEQDRSDLAGLILGWGGKIHAKNTLDKSPFQIALEGSPRMVSILLTRDRIGVPDDNGSSPLHIAILSNASAEIVKTMISQGAQVSAIDANGKTPLRLALDKGMWDQTRLLAEAGSNVFTVAGDGKCPAEIAIAKGREAINATFSSKKAIEAKDPTGNTVLHYAAQNQKIGPDLVSLLIDLGPQNKIARNISAESPGDVAMKWRRPDIAALLNS